MTFADRVLAFLSNVHLATPKLSGVEVLNPYRLKDTFELCRKFYKKYYDDDGRRTLILGINPGRHGAGLTGIPFTDPIKLSDKCGIETVLPRKPELSADFIYTMIEAYGGPVSFYSRFYISSVCPLGFTKDGKNLNYYDVKALQDSLEPFIISSLKSTLTFGIDTKACYCLGEGKNFHFLSRLNNDVKLFEKIIPLAHPRFIMQYRRKKMQGYVDDYVNRLRA